MILIFSWSQDTEKNRWTYVVNKEENMVSEVGLVGLEFK